MDNIPTLLKAFVIGGGVALLLGSASLVALLILRDGEGGRMAPPGAAPPIELALPAGARVEQVSLDGNRLVVLAVDGAGQQFLAVIDQRTGERLSLFRIRHGG